MEKGKETSMKKKYLAAIPLALLASVFVVAACGSLIFPVTTSAEDKPLDHLLRRIAQQPLRRGVEGVD